MKMRGNNNSWAKMKAEQYKMEVFFKENKTD